MTGKIFRCEEECTLENLQRYFTFLLQKASYHLSLLLTPKFLTIPVTCEFSVNNFLNLLSS